MVLFFGRRGQSLASSISFSTSQARLLPREGGEEGTENPEQREEMHTEIHLSFFSAIKDLAEEASPPRQVTWMGYVPSHILAPPPNYELFEAKITLIPKKKGHEHLLSACLALWLLFACPAPAHTGCPHRPFCALFGN